MKRNKTTASLPVNKSKLTARINNALEKIGSTRLNKEQSKHARKMMLKAEWK